MATIAGIAKVAGSALILRVAMLPSISAIGLLIWYSYPTEVPQAKNSRAIYVTRRCSKLENTLFSEEESKIPRLIAILPDYDT
jgi:hypothetical protein